MLLSAFPVFLFLFLIQARSVRAQHVIPTLEGSRWPLGNGFTLKTTSDCLTIDNGYDNVWSTVPGRPFIGASSGNDSIFESSGAFNITNIDVDACQSEHIATIRYVAWEDTVTGNAVQLSGSLLSCGDATAPYSLTLWVPASLTDRVAFYVNTSPSSDPVQPLKKLYFRYASHIGEDFYGLGAQASFASLKNQSIPIFSREQGVGRGDQPITAYENENGTFGGGNHFTTYTAIPSYITTDGRVFYLSENSTAYANFDLTHADTVTLRYDYLSVSGMFTRARNMFDAVEQLTAYTGRMPPLPAWVDTGAILGIQGGQAKVKNIVKEGLGFACPIAGVWLQDWAGPYINVSRLWWNWENDEDLYPTWNEFVQNLRNEYNVRTLSYVNCFLANVSTKPDGFRRDLYAEAAANKYFVQNTTTNSTAIISSGPGLDAGIIDLTNPGLRSWFTDVLKTQVWNANISGFMSDFGEYTPVTSDTKIYHTVSDAFYFHNQYPFLWAQFQREVANSLGLQDEALIFHRSAAMGANKYMNLFWAGDQNLDWGVNDGIKSVVTIMGHMGLSGYAHQHSDVGGYTDTLTYAGFNVTRSAELLGRWGELAAVSSAVFRSHEGNIPSVNAQFYSNSSTYKYYSYNARMFVSLGSYRRKILETECATRGWPLLRPPVMYHTDDLRAREISYESFYLGPNLYVAPVLDSQTYEVSVYLPGTSGRDSYKHVWTGVEYDAGQDITVSALYGKPAVFIVNGAHVQELEPFLEFVKQENGTQLTMD